MKKTIDKEMLRKIIVKYVKQNGKDDPVLIPLEPNVLNAVLFEDHTFCKEISEVLTMIDFSNVPFDGFDAFMQNFTQLTGVKINPQKLHNKDLRFAVCEGVEFVGSFADAKIEFTDFTNSIGASFDPKEVHSKSLVGTTCADVEFTDVVLHSILLSAGYLYYTPKRAARSRKNLYIYGQLGSLYFSDITFRCNRCRDWYVFRFTLLSTKTRTEK